MLFVRTEKDGDKNKVITIFVFDVVRQTGAEL